MKERSPESIRDELLALKAGAGDALALDELLRRWQKRLWGYLHRLSGDEQASWDLLQETCLSIASSIPRLKQPEAFASMAYRVAHRRFVDWTRADARRRRLKENAAEASAGQRTQGGNGTSETRDLIRAALARLEPDNRAILTLAYLEGFSYEEIASTLDIPVGTVKSRLHHARDEIRKAIGKETP